MNNIIPRFTVALIGSPNCGKTALFNALTNSQKKSTNYPGVTIDIHSGKTSLNDKEINFIDLPGLYSCQSQSFDESITRDYLLKRPNKFFNQKKFELQYDAIIVVADATQLEKTLYLALEILEAKIPFMLVLTHLDQASKRGQVLDLKSWSKDWKTPIYAIDNFNNEDIKLLLQEMNKLDFTQLKQQPEKQQAENIQPSVFLNTISTPAFVSQAFKSIDQLLKKYRTSALKADTLTKKIDKVLLHPIFGLLSMGLVLIFMFQILFTIAAPLQEMIENFFSYLIEMVNTALPASTFRDLITEGIISGAGSVLVFLPQISLLSLLITLLEDSGYLSRVAFLLDGFMKRLSLPGKAVIPLLTSHACAIPGIMATRNLDNEEDRLTTMMIAPLTTCSARIPVYTLLIAALIPSSAMFGPISYQALTMFGLYFLGIATSFLVGFILKRKVFKAKAQHLLIQLPKYKVPRIKNVWQNVRMQSGAFLTKAGGVILVLTIVIWFLASFPKQQVGEEPRISYVESIGKMIQPVLAPLGFDWKLSAALIPSFAAREVMVSALATVNAIEIEDTEDEQQVEPLKNILRDNYDLGTIVALLMWFVFAPQCISTFAVLKKETNGYYWPAVTFGYSLLLAYFTAWIAKLLL